jgi:tRNA A37 threonylcarbamoyladenosine synthetase subunit TsaC/SUA5/YrdC
MGVQVDEQLAVRKLTGDQVPDVHGQRRLTDSGDCGTEPTTVIDFSQEVPEIVRRGSGDTSGFE